MPFQDCYDPREPIDWFWKTVAEYDLDLKKYIKTKIELSDD